MLKFSEKTRFFVLLAGVFAALAFLLVGSNLAMQFLDSVRNDERKGHRVSTKNYQRTLAEGVRVSRHGCYGIDFIECGSCRVEKMRKGPLTLGGLNVLAIDDLKIVLPPKGDEWIPGSSKNGGKHSAAHDVAKRLGVSDGFLKNNGLPLKFSGIRIKSLVVDRLQDFNSRPEKVFYADSGEAVREGLSLTGCTIFLRDPDGEFVGKAMLSKSGDGLRLSWRGGEFEI